MGRLKDLWVESIEDGTEPEFLAAICCACATEKTVDSVSVGINGKRVMVSAGKKWNGSQCPECLSRYQLNYRRRAGIKPIDQVGFHTIKKGREAERKVAEYLLSNGYTDISLTDGHGPDVRAVSPNGAALTVEVKSVCLSRGDVWMVKPVRKNRENDDFIAFVSPDGRVVVVEMKDHLSKCGRSGSRSVKRLFKE